MKNIAKMMILHRNIEQGQDNDKWSWNDISEKFHEEATELKEAIGENNNLHIAEEALDVIQVCIGILDKLGQEGIDVHQMFLRHNKKLIKRHWMEKGVVEIKWHKNV